VTADEGALDAALVAALYVEHAEELRRFLLGVLRDPQLASDALQATFVKLVEKGGSSREESRKAWLFRVAFHEALALRRRADVDQRAVRRAAWSASEASSAADEPLLRLEVVNAVRRALDELPPDQRAVVRRRIYDQQTFAEIARDLGIPLGTALGRMRAALIRLREQLAPRDSS